MCIYIWASFKEKKERKMYGSQKKEKLPVGLPATGTINQHCDAFFSRRR